jgi:hypothetical protein
MLMKNKTPTPLFRLCRHHFLGKARDHTVFITQRCVSSSTLNCTIELSNSLLHKILYFWEMPTCFRRVAPLSPLHCSSYWKKELQMCSVNPLIRYSVVYCSVLVSTKELIQSLQCSSHWKRTLSNVYPAWMTMQEAPSSMKCFSACSAPMSLLM